MQGESKEDGLEFRIKSVPARRALMALEVAVLLGAVGWIVKVYAAYELSRNPSVENFELAVRLDPGNGEHRLKLGRLYQYNVADLQPEKAAEQFRRAAQLNPSQPQVWLELAAGAEFQGKMKEAEEFLRRADSLAPNSPAYQWPIANFYLLQGNIGEAFRHFRVVLAGTSRYDGIIFRTAWKASEDTERILRDVIPKKLSTEFSYLYFLSSQKKFTEAHAVWERIVNGPEPFTPQRCAGYIEALINARRPDQAFQVWTDMQEKGLIRYPGGVAEDNLLTNGDFEDEMVNIAFGWQIAALEGVYAGLDVTTYHSPGHALLVRFAGTQNLHYMHVYQHVKVSPGRSYRLQAFVKTEGITTESGPRLEVRDAYDAAALDKVTENLIGNTTGWNPTLLDFRTGPKTELLVVSLTRFPSRKLDSLIAGKVWVDDVRLTPLPESRGRP